MFVEFKIKIHIRMQKRCIWILGVRQTALSAAHEMWWWCRCHRIIIFLSAYPVEPTRCSAAALFIKNIAEKENINAEKILFTSQLKPSRLHRMHISRIF